MGSQGRQWPTRRRLDGTNLQRDSRHAVNHNERMVVTRLKTSARLALAAGMVALGAQALIGGPAASQTSDPADALRLNQLQFLGSHNSFHIAPDLGLYEFMQGVAAGFGQDPADLLYTHAPLREQFDTQGIRQIELDVFADPAGGRYATPVANLLESFPDYAPNYEPWSSPELSEPGMKVLHIQDFDMKTTCLSLISCLQQVKGFHDAQPAHVPIAILIEGKEDVLPTDTGITFVEPLPFTAGLLDDLDAEIRSVFSETELFTPDDLRGTHATLDEAVTTDGWPTLGELRGKVMFLMDNGGAMKSNYLAGHPALQGRVLFTSANPGDPDAAFVKLNDPIGDAAAIQAAVNGGYVVRTRADTPTDTVETGDTTQRDAAFASGAHWVSTDYAVAGKSVAMNSVYGTNFVEYSAPLPGGGIARCNPVTAVGLCNFAVTEPTTTTTTTTTTTSATTTSSSSTTATAPNTSEPEANPSTSTGPTTTGPTTTAAPLTPAPPAPPAIVKPNYTG